MADKQSAVEEENYSKSPPEDYNPLEDECVRVVSEQSDEVDSLGSSMDLEQSAAFDMYRYGVTPPRQPRQKKLNKEKDRSIKMKVAKRETSLTKKMGQRVTISGYESDEGAEESPEVSTQERRKDASRTFKTTRAYDRDYKHSASDLQSLESGTTPQQSAEFHKMHIDSPNRYMSLKSSCTPVPSLDSTRTAVEKLSINQRAKSFTTKECPPDRYKFHELFTQLIKLHLKAKPEKEPRNTPFNRQKSMDQEQWQVSMKDVTWLALQAWYNERTPQDEDRHLCRAREAFPQFLKQFMAFKYKKSSDTLQVTNKISYRNQISVATSDSSGVFEEPDPALQFQCEMDNLKSSCQDLKKPIPPVSSPELLDCIERQHDAIHQVEDLFDRLESFQRLYPSTGALGNDHPEYKDEEVQFRIDVLTVWLNLTKSIGETLQLMASELGLAGCEEIEWPWMNFPGPCQKLQALREGANIIVPNIETSPYEYPVMISTPKAKEANKQSKSVTFNLDASSKSSSETTTPNASYNALPSLDERNAPCCPYHLGVSHSNSYTNMDFSCRTAVYRYFVDQNLKKQGLGRLVHRLKSLLDGTLRKAKQVLERPPRLIRHSSSLLSMHDEECPELLAMSSSPALDGGPSILSPVHTDVCCSDFRDLLLPSFRPTFLFLVRLPLDIIHECIRLRLEQRPKKEPSIHSVRQLINECKEVLKGGVKIKQYYQQMVTEVTRLQDADYAGLDLDQEDFENDLKEILAVYFDYIQSYITALQRLSNMSRHLKNFLEEEWSFAKEVCPHISGGEANAGNRFCLMTNSLLESISDYLRDGMDECFMNLYDSTLGEDSLQLNPDWEHEGGGDVSPLSDLHSPWRPASRFSDHRQVINKTCRSIKEHFEDCHDRAMKALSFAKTLRADLEIAADFNMKLPQKDLLQKLQETNHVQVQVPLGPPGCVMLVPSGLSGDHIVQLLDVTCGREEALKTVGEEGDRGGYLLLLKADDEDAAWTGEAVCVKPTAATTIALSHLTVESLLLVVLHSRQLCDVRHDFKKAMGDAVEQVSEQTSCHQVLAESLADLKSSAIRLRECVVETITEVDSKLDTEYNSDSDEYEKRQILTQYQNTMHVCYNFGFEYHRELTKLVSDGLRCDLAHQMVAFTHQWCRFVCSRHERGNGVKPRWGIPGMEFLSQVNQLWVLTELSQEEYQGLRDDMNACVVHMIGEKHRPPAQPRPRLRLPRRSNPDITPAAPMYQRFQSCPDPAATASATPATRTHHSSSFSEPSTPYVAASSRSHAHTGNNQVDAATESHQRARAHTHVELGEGEDGGIFMDIHSDEDDGEEEKVKKHNIQSIREEIRELEQQQTDALYRAQQIGRITKVSPESDYPINMRRVNFSWRKSMKIGQGQFGKVNVVVNMESGELLAMKTIEFQHNDHKAIKLIADEIKVIEGITHPNLVRYYGVEVHRTEMLIFMEFCPKGTLEDAAKMGLSEPQARTYTRELLEAVSVLHEHAIIHRDIKGANIFLTESDHCKLGDFGCSIKLKNHHTLPGEVHSMKGTLAFMAPEVINNQLYKSGRATDIWSMGCVVIQMITGKRPWHDLEGSSIMFKVGMGNIPEVPAKLSEEGEDFLALCHQIDPKERWTASQLLDHPFVKVFNDDA